MRLYYTTRRTNERTHVVQDIRDKSPYAGTSWTSSRSPEGVVSSSSSPTASALGSSQRLQSHLGDDLRRPDTRGNAQKSAVAAVRATEAQVMTLRRLLGDTQRNIANAVGNRMDQARRMENQDAKEINEWGKAVTSQELFPILAVSIF